MLRNIYRYFTKEYYGCWGTLYILNWTGILTYDFKDALEGIEELHFSSDFNKDIFTPENQQYFKNVKRIVFDDSSRFNHPLDNLPINLEVLIIGSQFNQKLDFLPLNLEKLIFYRNGDFQQRLDNLPNKIKYIYLPFEYDLEISNLPSSVLEVDVGKKMKERYASNEIFTTRRLDYEIAETERLRREVEFQRFQEEENKSDNYWNRESSCIQGESMF